MFKQLVLAALLIAIVYSTACTSPYQCGNYSCDVVQELCYDTCTDENYKEKCRTNYCVNN